MLTLFDALQWGTASFGAWLGALWGNAHFGVIGGVLGAVLGAVLGVFVGRLPLVFAMLALQFRFRSEARLRRVFENDEYYIYHLALAHLMARGLDVTRKKNRVLDLLLSKELDRRRFGWLCLQIAFPEIAREIADFDVKAPSPAQLDVLRRAKETAASTRDQ